MKDNMTKIKVIACEVLTMVILIILGMILLNGSTALVKGNYEMSSKHLVTTLASNFESQLNLVYIKGETQENDELFYLQGKIENDKFVSSGKEYLISGNLKNNLEKSKLYFLESNEIFKDRENEQAIVYGYGEGESRIYKLQKSKEFMKSMPLYSFDNVMLVNKSGKVVMNAEENYINIKNRLDATNLDEMMELATANVKTLKLDGEKNVIGVKKVESEYHEPLFAVGNVADYKVQNYFKSEYQRILIALIFGGLVIFALYTFIVITLYKKNISEEKKFKTLLNKYTIIFDKNKDTLIAEKSFTNKYNLLDLKKVLNRYKLSDGKFIDVSLSDKDGFMNSFHFDIKSQGKKFILVATMNKLKTLSEDGGVMVKELPDELDMKNDIEKALLKGGKFLIGVIKLTNVKTFRQMFGKMFEQNLYQEMYNKAINKFGKSYQLSNSRIGVVVENEKESENILKDLQDIYNELTKPLSVMNNLVKVTMKMGFATVDKFMQNRTYDGILKCCYASLNRALDIANKTDFYVFHASSEKAYTKYYTKDINIEKMLESNCFEMEYQPQYSLKENRITGFESLFRIKKSAGYDISTYELITHAEKTGQIILLGSFIFNESMKFLKSVEDKDVTVSLNVSPVQLMQYGFVDYFMKIYDKYDIKAGRLCIEITESFLMTAFDDILPKLRLFKDHGISIHLDDFGVSYSSLLYLKKLPIDVVKIDREFIIDLETNSYCRVITDFIIKTAKELNLKCIAEGVERETQREILRDRGCDIIQGYIVGKSLNSDVARNLLEKEKENDK